MSSTIKRILLIILLLAVAAAIGLGIYYLFFKKVPLARIIRPPAKPPAEIAPLPPAGERAPIAPAEEIPPEARLPRAEGVPPAAGPSYYQPAPTNKITGDYASYPSLNQTANALRYHNPADGKFYRVMPDGSVKALTDQVFYNVKKITWADKQDKAVIEYPDGSKIVYDFERKKQITSLPKHWEQFSFSPEGSQIAAKSIGLSPENRWLVTTNDDGTGTKLIEPMGNNADQVIVDWSPSRQVVAFSLTGEPKGMYRREVLFVGLNHENFKSTVVEGMGFQPAWSATGKKMLYSVYSDRSDFKPELWMVDAYGDAIGNNRQLLQLNTWADKCVFASDEALFCAVPRDLPQGAGMAPALAADSYYDLYKIDLQTGLKLSIPLGDNYSIKNLTYDSQNNKVFFTDYKQNGIFEVKM